ncbi:SDR family oxidoreductase [Salipiger mucosus]|uniref:Short-chain dehydrogenase/reductase SDR n=1 Tax=Salipiger mucosus DSM 16094 TaxID=1123237 RepID=S9QRK6_9RHOB|nr:SDR family oxidoreductase [Salipiger mucosus]EPX82272.1 short-chain dehydrogenase/reductase SDR [Salipiger mucosus DSM 16094]
MATDSKVAVIIGATSKWQGDGASTATAHGAAVTDEAFPPGLRWGVGGALAQKFAAEGYLTIITTRRAQNAAGLVGVIEAAGGRCRVVDLDLAQPASIAEAFSGIVETHGAPDVVIYNAGYSHGRELPAGNELIEHVPEEIFETAINLACRGPYLVARAVLPAMRAAGAGSFFLTNNQYSLRGRQRRTGESLYYPRVLMRAFAQVLTEEYSPHGIHVANVIIDGMIDSPGTRAASRGPHGGEEEQLIDPRKIAEAYFYLHAQDPTCWSHEIQLTPSKRPVTF